MTQSELAEIMGVRPTAISNWEKEVSTPSVDMLIKLSRLFTFTLDDFLTKDMKQVGFHVGEVQESWSEYKTNKKDADRISAIEEFLKEKFPDFKPGG